MTETIQEFLDRTYVNFAIGKVFVFQGPRKLNKPETWTVLNAQNYLDWLQNNQKVQQ